MQIDCVPRQYGKTTRMIMRAANMDGYIVCLDHKECMRVFSIAQMMGTRINFPITFEEFLKGEYYTLGVKKVHIDNADQLLQRLSRVPIESISMSTDDE